LNTFIALFRGINVGGHNKLPMRELVGVLEELGFINIETYIQSGNVVFDCEESDVLLLSKKIQEAISKSHGFAPAIILLKAEEMKAAIDANPFREAEDEPKTLHLYFLALQPENIDMDRLESAKKANERYALKGNIFYLLAPDGIGRSKLAANVDKSLGVATTARNWRSVIKIMEMTKR